MSEGRGKRRGGARQRIDREGGQKPRIHADNHGSPFWGRCEKIGEISTLRYDLTTSETEKPTVRQDMMLREAGQREVLHTDWSVDSNAER